MTLKDNTPQLPLGQLLITPGAQQALIAVEGEATYLNVLMQLLGKHATHDWGVVCREDSRTNDWAVTSGARVISAYLLQDNTTKLWVITEADRSVTTVLLPEEY